jgi:hypothetical protein
MRRRVTLLLAIGATYYVLLFVAIFDVGATQGAIGYDGSTTVEPFSAIGPIYRRDCDDWICRYCSTKTIHKLFFPLNAIWAGHFFDEKSGFIIDVTKYN